MYLCTIIKYIKIGFTKKTKLTFFLESACNDEKGSLPKEGLAVQRLHVSF